MGDLDQLNDLLEQSTSNFYQLVLVVGRTGTSKTKLLQAFSQTQGISLINLNLELSTRMLELSSRARALRASSIIGLARNGGHHHGRTVAIARVIRQNQHRPKSVLFASDDRA